MRCREDSHHRQIPVWLCRRRIDDLQSCAVRDMFASSGQQFLYCPEVAVLEWNLETDGTIWLHLWGGNRLLNVTAAMFAVMKKKLQLFSGSFHKIRELLMTCVRLPKLFTFEILCAEKHMHEDCR